MNSQKVNTYSRSPTLTRLLGRLVGKLSLDSALKGFRHLIRGKSRIVLAWIYVLLLSLGATEPPVWYGLGLSFIGACLRFWASGYIRKDTRPAIGGPYAYVRNPLYLGTFFMCLGSALAVQSFGLAAGGSLGFALVYYFIVLDEEEKLERVFGSSYTKYCQNVPRFIPNLAPPFSTLRREVNDDSGQLTFSWLIARKNKGHEAYLSFFALWLYLTAMAWVWK